jgi:ribosomal protein S18 acetylase RimI-like enzyme
MIKEFFTGVPDTTSDDVEDSASLAEESDIHDIDTLLCSAREEIGLSTTFCANESCLKRRDWFRQKLKYRLLWLIRDAQSLVGVLVLEQDPFERIVGIAYVVVAERMRGRREIGPKLVRKAQALAYAHLKAEARNANSRRLLESCGFRWEEERSTSGHPIFNWSRT